ncbi:MAG TPA: hypothetical protein VMU05_06545 [Dongiaceae bacterium]|nr:hypothetical protein [Dongiaceae bacterium]
MSINPATNIATTAEVEAASTKACSGSPQEYPAPQPVTPNTGARPKQEIPNTSASGQSSEIVIDEVQVQQDSQTDGRIVIRYLDHSGDVILQVPSSQVLGLARAIDQALADLAKSRMPKMAEASGEEGVAHGH